MIAFSFFQGFQIFLACSFAVLIVEIALYNVLNNRTILNGLYNYISEMQKIASKELFYNKEKKDILNDLRNMKFGFLSIDEATLSKMEKKYRDEIIMARKILKNNSLMEEYVIVLEFNRTTFKSLKEAYAQKDEDGTLEEDCIENDNLSKEASEKEGDIIRLLKNMLLDKRDCYLLEIKNILVDITSRDRLVDTAHATDCSPAEICAILYKCLLGLLNLRIANQRYFHRVLKELQSCHVEMQICSYSQLNNCISKLNADNRDDLAYSEIKNIIDNRLSKLTNVAPAQISDCIQPAEKL